MSDTLRSKVIRLAHANPALRPHLLPLLKTAAWPIDVQKFRADELKKVPGVRVKTSPGKLVVTVGKLNPEVKDITYKSTQ